MALKLVGEAVFVPGDPGRLGAPALRPATAADTEIELVLPTSRSVRRRTVPARLISLDEAIPALLAVDQQAATSSPAAWSVAARAALGLIARDRLLPAASATGYDQWRVGPLDPADATFVQQLGAAFPADAHALPVTGSRPVAIRSATAAIRIALAAPWRTLTSARSWAAPTHHTRLSQATPMMCGGWPPTLASRRTSFTSDVAVKAHTPRPPRRWMDCWSVPGCSTR